MGSGVSVLLLVLLVGGAVLAVVLVERRALPPAAEKWGAHPTDNAVPERDAAGMPVHRTPILRHAGASGSADAR